TLSRLNTVAMRFMIKTSCWNETSGPSLAGAPKGRRGMWAALACASGSQRTMTQDWLWARERRAGSLCGTGTGEAQIKKCCRTMTRSGGAGEWEESDANEAAGAATGASVTEGMGSTAITTS